MNIALFSDCFYPTKNGVVTVVMQLRAVLQRMGHHVVIVTVDTSRLEGDEADGESSDPLIFRTHSVPLGFKTDNFAGFPHKSKIIKFLRSHNVEIIHCHTEFIIAQAVGWRCANRRLTDRKSTANSIVVAYYIERNRLLHAMQQPILPPARRPAASCEV